MDAAAAKMSEARVVHFPNWTGTGPLCGAEKPVLTSWGRADCPLCEIERQNPGSKLADEILTVIVAELRRQHDLPEATWDGLSWMDLDDLSSAGIDGQVDLVKLAGALVERLSPDSHPTEETK